ncbi:MAG: VapC toxin family PIN domain ribonuclease [Verrucomicrobia bacterium A1]|nr:MAG: VapC toxin family PIN domain ribonuclease [Verrucomicrobia bacterium A1]
MILVDTPIWVNHLRRGRAGLEGLLEDSEVVCHPFIVGELACGNLVNRKEILSLLAELPSVPAVDEDEFLAFIEGNRLAGSGLGFVDVHLLASARLSGVRLWTADRALRQVAAEMGIAHLG